MLRRDRAMVVFWSMTVWICLIVVTIPPSVVVLANRIRSRRMFVPMAMEYGSRSCQQIAGKRKRCPCSMVMHTHDRIIEVFADGSSIVTYADQDGFVRSFRSDVL